MNNSHNFSPEELNRSYDYNIPSMDIEEEDNMSSIILDHFGTNIKKEVEFLEFNTDEIYFNNIREKTTTKAEISDNNKKEEQNKADPTLVKSCGGGKVTKKTAKDKKIKEEKQIESEKTASSTEKTESKTNSSNEENKMPEDKDLNNNIINNKENKEEINNKEVEFIMIGIDNINLELENLLNNINNNIYINNNDDNNNDEKKMIGKKRKKKLLTGDNLIKNIRTTLLNYIFEFINKKIRILLNNEIGRANCVKQFIKITKKELYHSKVEYDKNFLNKKLKDILSFKISGKYSNYLDDHNINLVHYLISDEKNGNYFQSLFDLSFLNCLEFINGKKNYDLLEGLAKVDEIIEKEYKDLDEYEKKYYKGFIKDYDNIIKEKNSKSKK